MSLQPQPVAPVPEDTARVARAAFPKGTLLLRLRDELGALYADERFAALFPTRGQPAEAPGRLALITVLQFMEGLTDRQAADAVRGRIDWKYLLALDLTSPGFDHTVLSEFRARLIEGAAEAQLLDAVLELCRERGWLKPRGRQRTDSTHVLAAVRTLNRLERVGETLRHALDSLAVAAPEWLRSVAPPAWYERYGRPIENYRLPKADSEREALAATIGEDGRQLLAAIATATDLPWLGQVPAVKTLRQVWSEQYLDPPAPARWRPAKELAPAGELIASPHDPDARWSVKRGMEWVGYKAHVTETCDPARPHLITHIETTPATTQDDQMLDEIHADLAAADRLPGEHLVDTGYTTAGVLVRSEREHDVRVIGPVALDPSWQARAGTGFDKAQFVVDWEAQTVTCPAGKTSLSWLPVTDPTKDEVIHVRFSRADCSPCPQRALCTRRKVEPREVLLAERAEHEALQAARQRQTTEAFRAEYAARAGIEGTHAQAVARCGLRRARYRGLAKTRFQHVATAAALNLIRVGEWLAGTPLAGTRRSAFARLQPLAEESAA
jgi:transposase